MLHVAKIIVEEKTDKVLGVAIISSVAGTMISEAALTGKPIYIAEIPPKRDDSRFRKFRELFSKLNITRILGHSLDTWTYERLDETKKIAEIIKNKL